MDSELNMLTQILGSPSRIRILLHLQEFGAGFTSVNEMAKLLKMSPATLLRTLYELEKLHVAHYIQSGSSHLWKIRKGWPYLLVEPILNKIKNKKNSRDYIQQFVGSLSFDQRIKKIILYGSFSTHSAEPGSDIDIFVLSRGKTERSQIDADLDAIIEVLTEKFFTPVSILFRNEDTWEKLPSELKKNIEKGKILYDS